MPRESDMTGEIDMTGRAGSNPVAEPHSSEIAQASSLQSSSQPNPDSAPAPKRNWKRRVTLLSILLTVLAAGVVLPPLINVGRYQRQITALMSRSLGRPVHLSSVELRLLPTPGFVLHDLSVSENPAFGAEPILSARTVVATVRLFALWRGKLEVSRVSVDEASLNLVRTPQGRWNLESVMTGAAENPSSQPTATAPARNSPTVRIPYLEATNSRVNLKNGTEKSPFSIVDTDLSLWQDEPGAWRVRLKGQPVRTDMDISLADTGEVRMEASLHSAAQLREMPLKLQVEWRDAQLGQLSRMLLGSDAGWRGDMTADMEVQGTPDAALTKARLRATGVRRQEFAPETPLDFDANCTFRYQHPLNAVHNIDCNTAIGDGRLHLKAELPGRPTPNAIAPASPEALLEVRQIPVQAALDLLRTVRSDFAPGVVAEGKIDGSLNYKAIEPLQAIPPRSLLSPRHPVKGSRQVPDTSTNTDLTGSLKIEGGVLKGGGLPEPLTLPEIVWTPTLLASREPSPGAGLGTNFTVPVTAGTPSTGTSPLPIAVQFLIGSHGYRVALGGSGSVTKLRDLAYAFGFPRADAADGFTGGTADLDISANGPWIAPSDSQVDAPTDSLAGSLQLHHTQWKANFLAGPVDLPQATISRSSAGLRFDSEFTYPARAPGKTAVPPVPLATAAALAGEVTITLPASCSPADCTPRVELRFGALDAEAMQAALLGVPEKKSLLSPLIDRIRSTERPKWPAATVDVQADSLVLGTVTLHKPAAHLHVRDSEVVLDTWTASLLGGEATGTGSFAWGPDKPADKPQYSLVGDFRQITAAQLGTLLATHWTGGTISGSGNIRLSGLTDKDLTTSAMGDLSFIWTTGSFPTTVAPLTHPQHPQLPRVFDKWTGKIAIHDGEAILGENQLLAGRTKSSVEGGLVFGGPVKLSVHAPEK